MLHGLEAYGCRRQEPTSRQRVLGPFKPDERERVLGCLSTNVFFCMPPICSKTQTGYSDKMLYLKCQDIYWLPMHGVRARGAF
jgi:hypothetical protein